MRWTEEWRNTISENSPCGEDVSFGSEFEQLQDEIEKSTSIYADNPTDWDAIFTYATNILRDLSKDISALCYGSRAAFEKGGIPWLVEAIIILNDYLENDWENLHPQRPARRVAALQWLSSKLEALPITGGAFPTEEDGAYETLRESLKRLQGILDAKLGDNAPSFSAAIRALPNDTSQNIPLSPATPQTSQPVTPTSYQTSVQPEMRSQADSSNMIVSADILAQINRMAADQTKRLSLHYLTLNYTDWRAYLLNRVALWTTIPQLPQASDDKVTTLRPIPKDKQHGYQSAIQSKQYAAVLQSLERSAANQPYWLDGHFMVYQCLEALGADAAKEMICLTLKHFIALFPEITSFKYFDKTPFAAPATIQWIESLESADRGGDDLGTSWLPGSSTGVAEQSGSEETLLHAAVEKGRKGGFEAGLAVLGTISGLRSRNAVRLSLLQARYCLAMDKPKNAKQLLSALYRQLDQWGLMDWEPELSAQIIALLLSLQKGNSGKEHDEMIRKLHWLHLETAVKVAPK